MPLRAGSTWAAAAAAAVGMGRIAAVVTAAAHCDKKSARDVCGDSALSHVVVVVVVDTGATGTKDDDDDDDDDNNNEVIKASLDVKSAAAADNKTRRI